MGLQARTAAAAAVAVAVVLAAERVARTPFLERVFSAVQAAAAVAVVAVVPVASVEQQVPAVAPPLALWSPTRPFDSIK